MTVAPPAVAADRSIAETAARVRAGVQPATELVELYLARIAALDGSLNAFRFVDAEGALRRAREIDEQVARGEDPGPLAGVPIAVKDNIAVGGLAMTAASGFLRDHVAQEDAVATQRLRSAGAVVLGTLHMAEWALGGTTQNIHFGDGHNPWDVDRVPGGSSGGSATAVAADLVLAALGTDTGGSIRIPSALCGVVGLRSTLGRVSTRGTFPVAWSFDTIGPLARRVADVAAVLEAIAGYDRRDPVSVDAPVGDLVGSLDHGVAGLRLGILGGAFREAPLTAATAGRLEDATTTLGDAGMAIAETTLDGLDEAVETTAKLQLAEAAAFHERRVAEHPEGFAPDVLARLRRGQAVTGPAYGAARQHQRAWRRQVLEALGEHDVLLSPACGTPAPLIAECDPLTTTAPLARFAGIWSLAGVPTITVPVGFVDGLPVAMQLIGRPFAEATLLRVAHAYQQVTDWHERRPALPPVPAQHSQGRAT